MRTILLVSFLLFLGAASFAETHPILLDGKVLPGLGYVLLDGEPYLPLPEIAAAAKIEVKTDAAGTAMARGMVFKGRRVGSRFLYARSDVKRALNATVYVEKGRVMVVTEAGREKVGLTGPSTVPGGTGTTPTAGGARGGGGLTVYAVEVDRDTSGNRLMRVRASVRNDTGRTLRDVTVTFSLWEKGTAETTDPLTGDAVANGEVYSNYPMQMGDFEPGEVKQYQATTQVMSPAGFDFAGRVVHLDVRDLRYGFLARAANASAASMPPGSVPMAARSQVVRIESVRFDVERGFDSGSPPRLVLRGVLRNLTNGAVAGQLVAHFWQEDKPSQICVATGEPVPAEFEYSSYGTPFSVGANATTTFEIQTRIADPRSVDATGRSVSIDLALGTTMQLTRLKVGFEAK